VIGLIGYADQIRPEAQAVVRNLRNLGIREIVMLTGDHRDVAQHVAQELGITTYEAEVLPPRKVEAVKELQARGYRVAFVGDGINDSPALAHADIGLAVKTSLRKLHTWSCSTATYTIFRRRLRLRGRLSI
jgi:cation-transporting P-type ATPase C